MTAGLTFENFQQEDCNVASNLKPCDDLSVTEVKDMCTVMEKVRAWLVYSVSVSCLCDHMSVCVLMERERKMRLFL